MSSATTRRESVEAEAPSVGSHRLIVAVHQPTFLPWAGFFHKLANADVLVLLDEVQFRKGGDPGAAQNRVLLKTSSGLSWLTAPVARTRTAGDDRARICDVTLADHADADALIERLRHALGRATHYAALEAGLRPILTALFRPGAPLVDLNIALIRQLATTFGLNSRIVRQSTLERHYRLQRNELLVSLCRELGATRYLTGTGALGYLDRDQFADAGIAVDVQRFDPHPYGQLWDGDFDPGVTALDALAHLGPDAGAWLRR